MLKETSARVLIRLPFLKSEHVCGASVKMQHDAALRFLSGTTVLQQTATTAVEARKINFV